MLPLKTLKAPSIVERDIERALSRRGKALLEAPDLARQVGELEPLEAYFMVKELGLESAVLILLAASEEQLKTFVDLDCWNQDELSVEDLDAWLAPFAAIGPEPLVDAFNNLDEEIQHVFLKENLLIFERLDKEAPMPRKRDETYHDSKPRIGSLSLSVHQTTKKIEKLMYLRSSRPSTRTICNWAIASL